MRSIKPAARAFSVNCGLASKAAMILSRPRCRSSAAPTVASSYQDCMRRVSCSRSGGVRFFSLTCRRERRIGLHPDLIGRGSRQIIAEPGRIETLAMRDDELAGLAELLDGSADFLCVGDRKVCAADPQRHAFHAPVAFGGIETEHDIH